jgi:hypothetical protein
MIDQIKEQAQTHTFHSLRHISQRYSLIDY